ncbi:MAG: RsiV family protein [Firmicutes bacterium]|nr:RsiV family protein [Bacillota bacterium]
MKMYRRMLALLLCAALLSGMAAMPAAAEEYDEADTLREGVFTRYETYITGSNTFSGLLNGGNYSHWLWANEIMSKSDVEKGVMWASDFLLGTSLNKDAYVDYLAKILTLFDMGFAETVSAQADYTETSSGMEKLCDLGSATVQAVLQATGVSEIGDGIKLLTSGIGTMEGLSDVTMTYSQALILMHFAENYKEKVAFLEAIRDNTDDEALKEAAEVMIESSGVLCSYYGWLLLKDTTLDFAALVNGGFDIGDCMELIGEGGSKMFADWAADLSFKGADILASGSAVLSGASLCFAYLPCVWAGFQLGSAIMSLFFGDQAELYREAKAMTTIGEALCEAIPAINEIALTSTDEDARYEAIYQLVACGEALCYVRLRGEYCAVESVRGSDGAPEDLDEIFENICDRLNRCYDALAKIFPDDSVQVVVTVDPETENSVIDTSIAVVDVYVSNRQEVSQAITSSETLLEMYESARSVRDDVIADAVKYPELSSYSYYDLKLYGAYATDGALSLEFMEIVNESGVHPNSYRYYFTFDLNTGEELAIADLLDESNPSAEEDLTSALAQVLYDMHVENNKDYDTCLGIIEKVLDPDGYSSTIWGFMADGFTITFSPYMIAAYAMGYIEVTIPYSELSGMIDSAYFPTDWASRSFQSDVTVDTVGSEEAAGYDNCFGQTGTAAIWASGALNVTLGEGKTVNSQAYLSNVLFYANYMTARDLYWLPEEGVYLVEYDVKTDQTAQTTHRGILITASGGSYASDYTELYEG